MCRRFIIQYNYERGLKSVVTNCLMGKSCFLVISRREKREGTEKPELKNNFIFHYFIRIFISKKLLLFL